MAKRGKGWPVTNFTMYEDLDPATKLLDSIIRLFNFLGSNRNDFLFFLSFFDILLKIFQSRFRLRLIHQRSFL